MPGIPLDCDRLAEKLALLHLRLFLRPFSSHATECIGIVGEGTSLCRFKSVPTSVIADGLAYARQTRLSSWRLAYPILSCPIPCCQLVVFDVYEVGEVFPWGGISVIFSVCVSISSVSDPLHEIDLWLDFRHTNKFYGAWISQNYKPWWCNLVTMHAIKIFETTVISC